MMTTAAALCAAPLLALGQQNTGGSSQMQTTTQSTPQQGTAGGAPTTGVGNAPAAQGTTTNPAGNARGDSMSTSGGPAAAPGAPGAAAQGNTRAGDRAATAPATTGATTGTAAVDSARITGGRRASKVIGSNVYTEQNESIGEVDDIIIPQGSNQPVAIISVGGFLGIGARLVAVPYERLQHASDRDRWVLPGATKDSLKDLPAFTYEGDTVQQRRG